MDMTEWLCAETPVCGCERRQQDGYLAVLAMLVFIINTQHIVTWFLLEYFICNFSCLRSTVLLVLIPLLNLLCVSLHKDLISAVVRNSHCRYNVILMQKA